ncbi:hypothetical protein GCM10010363_42400 [Streptomyces omiyaensis]|nr:hypothetical protein GCM10010363_42400 [Streptomyces omiyaensis]
MPEGAEGAAAPGSSTGPQPQAPAPRAARPAPVPVRRSTVLRETPRPSCRSIRPPLTWSDSLFDGGEPSDPAGRRPASGHDGDRTVNLVTTRQPFVITERCHGGAQCSTERRGEEQT